VVIWLQPYPERGKLSIAMEQNYTIQIEIGKETPMAYDAVDLVE